MLQAAFDVIGTAESTDDFRRAFLVLLRSEDVAARGVALDFYDRAGATSRSGEGSPFERFHDEVVVVARETLAGPPRPEDDIAFAGADHASALLAIENDVRPEDGAAVPRGHWYASSPKRRTRTCGGTRRPVVAVVPVGKHVGSVLGKLDLPLTEDTNRRVLAVLAYLRSTAARPARRAGLSGAAGTRGRPSGGGV